MAFFRNKYQMYKATDEEIKEFFASTVFEGIFSTEIKSSHTDYYKGHIHSIKINGEPNNVIGNHINVPISACDIPEGPCTFKCRVKDEVRISPNQINFSMSPRTLRSKTESPSPISITEKQLTNEDLFELWGVDSCECIGYYHYDAKREGYIIDDLRKTNFDRIPPYLSNKREISLWLKYPLKGLELGNYYRFTWKLSHKDKDNPYEIYIDTRHPVQPITPKWFIENLFEDRHRDKSKNFGSAANFLDTLSKQLSARESTFVYELLQNANDYPVVGQMVDVEFHITDSYLLFQHSGDKFNVRNISGICGINEKEKVANKKTIGYKGIGFKTVFLNNHYVYLRTGEYSFRFDEGESPEKKRGGKIKRQNAPFQILPIWTEHDEVSSEVNSVFDRADKKFQVQIALRPDSSRILHYGKNSYENLFREVFSDSNIILFIPNINSVRVFINGREERACFRNNKEWIVGDYENKIDEDLQILINNTIDKGNSRIPDKYKDFDYTKVSFACKHDGAIIKPVEDATLYCYLPTRASWGLPFLMNTDMIPKGDRNDIETEVKLLDEDETNFNEELASIAGAKLFLWIRELLTSKKYHLGSVFSLVPDFKKCKREHKEYTNFIDRFEEAFNDCLKSETIVPIIKGIALVNTVILDTTGLSSSGIMTDEEFRKFTGLEDYYLPFPLLRKDKHFNSFLKRYAEDDQKFEEDNIEDLIANEDFQEWLKDQDNNNKFLIFLLEKGYLKDHLDKKIFLSENGTLNKADDLYLDVDSHYDKLSSFDEFIPRLSLATREALAEYDGWSDAFRNFECDVFVNSTLLSEANIERTKTILKNKQASIDFYSFLANNVKYSEDYLTLPVIDHKGGVIENFNPEECCRMFVFSDDGIKVLQSTWIEDSWIKFISDDYDKETIDYFKANFDIHDYSDAEIMDGIILNSLLTDKINAKIEDLSSSKSFLSFIYKNREHSSLEDGSLKNYCLLVNEVYIDQDGNEVLQYLIPNDDVIYIQNRGYIESKLYSWLNEDWMFSISNEYFKGMSKDDVLALQKLIIEKFNVNNFTEKNFYDLVVANNVESIKHNILVEASNLSFYSYLSSNYAMIFKDGEGSKTIYSLPVLIDADETDDNGVRYATHKVVEFNKEYAYIDDSKHSMSLIMAEPWFPEDLILEPSAKYEKVLGSHGNYRSLFEALGFTSYTNLNDFFSKVLCSNGSAISQKIQTKVSNISFHNFVIGHLSEILEANTQFIKDLPVYLYNGEEEPTKSEKSTDHYIASSELEELFEEKIIPPSLIDTISNDYDKSSEYWQSRLGNVNFTPASFRDWATSDERKADFIEELKKTSQKNIAFWRWVRRTFDYKKSDKSVTPFNVFPVLRKTSENVVAYVTVSNGSVYMPNTYFQEGKGFEEAVTKYCDNAIFVSDRYYDAQNSDITPEEWRAFFKQLKVKDTIEELVFDKIIPLIPEWAKLSDILLCANNASCGKTEFQYDATLPLLLGEYFDKIEANWEKVKDYLQHLRVMTKGGRLLPVCSCYIIDEQSDKEPFKLISIADEICDQFINNKNTFKLLKKISEEFKGNLITSYTSWVQAKIKIYAGNESSFSEEAHLEFIDELSQMKLDDVKGYDGINSCRLLNRKGQYVSPSTLTLGDSYSPLCNFEKNGISDLEYISNKYRGEKLSISLRDLFTKCFNVVYKFEEQHLCKLSVYTFAIYFWGTYINRANYNSVDIGKMFSDGKFDQIDCVPTVGGLVKKPVEIYEDKLATGYVKNKVFDWENKLASLDIKVTDGGLFGKLPFLKQLNFADCVYALGQIKDVDKRFTLLSWMIESYDETVHKELIKSYRESEKALWKNGKGDYIHLKDLYAIDINSEKLVQYFKDNDQVISLSYFSSVPDTYLKMCGVLDINVIYEKDMTFEPSEGTLKGEDYKKELTYRSMIAAGIEGGENWKELYNKFSEELLPISFWECSAISWKYSVNPSIRQTTKKFFYQENEVYFVEKYRTHYFGQFAKYIYDRIGSNLDIEKFMEILDFSIRPREILEDYHSLLTNKEFVSCIIVNYDKDFIGIDLEDEEPEYQKDDNDFVRGTVDVGQESEEPVAEVIDIPEEPVAEEFYTNGVNQTTTIPEDKSISDVVDITSLSNDDETEQTFVDAEETDEVSALSCESQRIDPEESKTRNVPTQDTASPYGQSTKRATKPQRKQINPWDEVDLGYAESPIEKYKPKVRKVEKDITEWKKQAELGIADPTSDEIEAIRNVIGGGLTTEQIVDEHYLTRYRLYNKLKEDNYGDFGSMEDFMRSNEYEIATNKGYIYARSARGGILFVSSFIWDKLKKREGRLCMFYGTRAYDFEIVESIDKLVEYVGNDNIIVQIKGKNKLNLISSVFSGSIDTQDTSAHVLIRIKSNERYNSIFQGVYTNDDNNSAEID